MHFACDRILLRARLWGSLSHIYLLKVVAASLSQFQQNAEMRFHFLCRFLSVLLLLIALACAAQGGSLRERNSFVFGDIGNALNNVGQTLKKTVKSIFQKPSTTANAQPDPTFPAQNVTLESRRIIDVPSRCPPNHVLVNGRCRLIV